MLSPLSFKQNIVLCLSLCLASPALAAPTVTVVDAVAAPAALLERGDIASNLISRTVDTTGLDVHPGTVARDTIIMEYSDSTDLAVPDNDNKQLSKRYLTSSPYQRRIIDLTLKKALHGIPAGTKWLFDVIYKYAAADAHLGYGPRVIAYFDQKVPQPPHATFDFPAFVVQHADQASLDAVVSASFTLVNKAAQKLTLKLVYDETFNFNGAELGQGRESFCTYYAPISGHAESLDQTWFSYSMRQVAMN